MKKIFVFILIVAVSGMLFAGGSSESSAESKGGAESTSLNWPEKDIFINVHAKAGNLDTAMRLLAPFLAERLGVNIIVENRPGGSQAVSQVATQGAAADGYTFQTFTGSTSFSMASGAIPFGPKDWSVVSSIQREPASIAVLADSELKTIDDLVEALKKDPDSYIIGGYQSASFMRYVYYQLQDQGGFSAKWIPIDTTKEVAAALLGKHIDVAIMTPSTTGTAVKRGDVRLLGIATDERSKTYPDVPTFKEQGYDMVEILWRGLGAKKGTDPAIIKKMADTIREITETDEWQEIQKKYNQENDPVSPEELDKRLLAEVTGRTKFLKELGIKK